MGAVCNEGVGMWMCEGLGLCVGFECVCGFMVVLWERKNAWLGVEGSLIVDIMYVLGMDCSLYCARLFGGGCSAWASGRVECGVDCDGFLGRGLGVLFVVVELGLWKKYGKSVGTGIWLVHGAWVKEELFKLGLWGLKQVGKCKMSYWCAAS